MGLCSRNSNGSMHLEQPHKSRKIWVLKRGTDSPELRLLTAIEFLFGFSMGKSEGGHLRIWIIEQKMLDNTVLFCFTPLLKSFFFSFTNCCNHYGEEKKEEKSD
ncbi:hypothetical protein AB6A40_008450 [Gnathostoma spinigerum]|uniref:Uncharacterized protein n=1 Tax=Gnathostoma spinigerum TaxID=75299 RepID=A0ABD6EPH9_9BILA